MRKDIIHKNEKSVRQLMVEASSKSKGTVYVKFPEQNVIIGRKRDAKVQRNPEHYAQVSKSHGLMLEYTNQARIIDFSEYAKKRL